MPGYDSCVEQRKTGSELLYLFDEKMLRFKKIMHRLILRFVISMQWRAEKSAKELSHDALITSNVIPLSTHTFCNSFSTCLNFRNIFRPSDKSAKLKKKSYFSAKTYVVGTQKNHLNKTVLLITQNTMDR